MLYKDSTHLAGTTADSMSETDTPLSATELQNLFHSVNEAIFVHDQEGDIVDVNQAAADMYGYSQPELREGDVGPISSGEPPYTTENAKERIERATEGEAQTFEWQGLDRDGNVFWEEVTLSRMVVDGETRVLAIVRDIDDRIERERRLERQNELLEEFASVVSHDLRSPLSVAAGRLELVKEDCSSPHLAHIDQALDRMGLLIEDILQLTRENETVDDLEPVDLAELALDCWLTVETADATLVTDFADTIEADENRLRQIFENLFRNAIEYGGENVTLRIGELGSGFYVEDDGPGIPEKDRDKVFEAGYTEAETGTGLGLNIVKQVVEAHDWEISVTEGTEGGSRFEIIGIDRIAE